MSENGRSPAAQLEPAQPGNRLAAKHLAYATFTPAELDEVRALEAAACWSVDRMNRFYKPRTAYALLNLVAQPDLWLKQSGIFVTVFHFNTPFDSSRDSLDPIGALFLKLCRLRRILRLNTLPFGDIPVMRRPSSRSQSLPE
jgi:hypothetical protein